MNEDYSEYLNSEAWQNKRMQRLVIANFRCAACGTKKHVQVHHLTYERIFNEAIEDLLPLCRLHHEAAEELKSKGLLPRAGDVRILASETLRLVIPLPHERQAIIPDRVRQKSDRGRNPIQDRLLSEPWFEKALAMKQKHFKKLVRKKFKGFVNRIEVLANCDALFRRIGRGSGKKSSKAKTQKPKMLPAICPF